MSNTGVEPSDYVEKLIVGLRNSGTVWTDATPDPRNPLLRFILTAWNPARTMLAEVSVVDIVPDDEWPQEEGTQISIAFYDDQEQFMLDCGFGLSYYAKSLELIDEIFTEELSIEVYGGADNEWHGAACVLHDREYEREGALYVRSWLGSYDRSPTPLFKNPDAKRRPDGFS